MSIAKCLVRYNMNIADLVRGISNCECGKMHICPIKHIIIESDAINTVSDVLSNYSAILLVADENTYKAAGAQIKEIIKSKIASEVIFSGKKILVPDEYAIAEIEAAISKNTDLILGVGSGVINDLCKYVSFKNGLPYQIVATAPSMDGYASRGAALILGGMKVTKNANVPEAIIADVNVLKNAPIDMIVSGYGDIIGKYSCLNDWKLANIVNGEYICNRVIDATYEEVYKTAKLANGLKERSADSVKALMKALIAVGILMAYVGNSRPASGSEHHFSHFFEIVGILNKEKYLPHGIDVAYSALETAKMREKLVSITDISDFQVHKLEYKKYKNNIEKIYTLASDEVLALQARLGWYNEAEKRMAVYKEKWQEIRKLLMNAPSFSEMQNMLSAVGITYSDFIDYYGEEKINIARKYAKDLKDRYTVLWLWWDILS